MELTSSRFPAFLKSRDPKLRIFLFYGPDEGLVRELSRSLCLSVVDSLDDPFRFIDIQASDLTSDPTRLMDEVTAISMMGGERVVRLRGANNNSKGYLEPATEQDLPDSLLVIEAGDIRKDSALVKMINKAPHGVVTHCAHDKAQDILGLIKEVLGAANIDPPREVIDYLRENLGSDRAISRQELDKLVLYSLNSCIRPPPFGMRARAPRMPSARQALSISTRKRRRCRFPANRAVIWRSAWILRWMRK